MLRDLFFFLIKTISNLFLILGLICFSFFFLFCFSIHLLHFQNNFSNSIIALFHFPSIQSFLRPLTAPLLLKPETSDFSKHIKFCGRHKSPPDCLDSIQIKYAADPATPLLMTPPKQNISYNMQFREVVGCFSPANIYSSREFKLDQCQSV
jgi:hypothetical protein